jgi:hypothetical protein
MICGERPAFCASGACAYHSICERHCRPMIRMANGNGRFPTQIMEEIEQPLSENRAAHHRIVGAGEPDARDFHHLFAERALLLVQLLHRELRKARLLAARRQSKEACGKPAAGRGKRKRGQPEVARFHDVSSAIC